MKRYPKLLAVVLGLVAVAVCGCDDDDDNGITGANDVIGSGVLDEETRAVSGFAAVVSTTIGELHITPGVSETLRIEAEDNLLEHIITDVAGGVLELKAADGVDLEPTLPIKFFITVQNLNQVHQVGAGDVEIDATGLGDVDLLLTGVGTIECTNLDATDLDVQLAGVGNIVTSGEAQNQDIVITGEGDYLGRELATVTTDVTITGIGSATVQVSDSLVAVISGIGSVYYLGDPTVQSTITGVGSVSPIE